jgi:hypothetical protein
VVKTPILWHPSMSEDVLSNFIAAFDKIAARREPSFDPREDEDFGVDINYDPEDDYDRRKYEGMTHSEPGSNYSHLTQPLEEHSEDERVEFARYLLIIEKHYRPLLIDVVEEKLQNLTTQSKFTRNINTALIAATKTLASLYNNKSLNNPQDVINKVRLATRDALYIKSSLSSYIETQFDEGYEWNILSQYKRVAEQISIIGKNMLKALNAATSKSYKKRRGNNNWEF